MSERVCGTCGNSYRGSACPVCAVQESIRQQTAALLAAQELESRRQDERAAALTTEMKVAAEKQRESLAQAWRIQAEAKVKRASELFQAQLDDEALQLVTQALEQDPGNLHAYIIAAWIQERRDEGKALHFYRKQISLLRAEPYTDNVRWPQLVLRSLPQKQEIMNELSHTICSLAPEGYWGRGDSSGLISGLIEVGLCDAAIAVIQAAIQRQPSMKLYGYWLDITGGDELAIVSLRNYFTVSDYEKQNDLLREFHALATQPIPPQRSSLDVIKEIIKNFYDDYWKPQRDQVLRQKARQQARSQSVLLALGGGFVVWWIGLNLLSSVLVRLGVSNGCSLFLGFTAAVAGAVFIFVMIQRKMASAQETRLLEKALAEEAKWGLVVGA